jgi:hypothetical protein
MMTKGNVFLFVGLSNLVSSLQYSSRIIRLIHTDCTGGSGGEGGGGGG